VKNLQKLTADFCWRKNFAKKIVFFADVKILQKLASNFRWRGNPRKMFRIFCCRENTVKFLQY
jgi:hypothetical protein